MLKSLRTSFAKSTQGGSSSTATLTSAPTPISNLPPPTSKVSFSKQLAKSRALYQEGISAYDAEKYHHSFTCLQEAVQIQELSLGKYHEETIRSYWRLGRAACKCTYVPTTTNTNDKQKNNKDSDTDNPTDSKKRRHVALQAFQRAARMGEQPLGAAQYETMIQDMKDSYQLAFAGQAETTISTSGSVSGGSDNQSVNSSFSGHWSNEDSSPQQQFKNIHQDPMKHLQKVFELEQKGDGHVKKKNYRKASSTYSQALQLQDALVGDDSLDGADIRCKLALCFMNTGNGDQARRALQMAYTCFVAQVGTDHPATLGAVARMKKIAGTSTMSVTTVGSS